MYGTESHVKRHLESGAYEYGATTNHVGSISRGVCMIHNIRTTVRTQKQLGSTHNLDARATDNFHQKHTHYIPGKQWQQAHAALVHTQGKTLQSSRAQRYSSCRYNERQLIEVTVVRRVRPRAERWCDCEGHRRRKRAGRTTFCN